MVDLEIKTLFDDDLVKENVSCKSGCAACCHTQVSITFDEAELLASKIVEGTEVDLRRLRKLADTQNNAEDFYRLSYEDRACPFLGDGNICSAYEDRPSVCRTNNVVSDPVLCETKDGNEKPVRLLNTHKADMIVMASFKNSKENGALPTMLWKALKRLRKSSSDAVVKKL